MMNNNLVEELKGHRQWVICFTEDKIPLTLSSNFIKRLPEGYAENDEMLSNELFLHFTKTDKTIKGDLENSGCFLSFSKKWMSYNLASKIVRNYIYNNPSQACDIALGYVLVEAQAYTVIDLDRDDNVLNADYSVQNDWIKRFDSYTERSVSGNGFHIWVKGKIPSNMYPKLNGKSGSAGVRSSANCDKSLKGFEVYCQDRFITVTTDVIEGHNVPFKESNNLITELCNILKDPYTVDPSEQKFTPKLNDLDLLSEVNFLICSISNTSSYFDFIDLFLNKCNYEYVNNVIKRVNNPEYHLTFPSQSEADLRFFCLMLKFSDNEQVIKSIFSLSELGKRAKATRNDYLTSLIQCAKNSLNNDVLDENVPNIDSSTQEFIKEEKKIEKRKKLVDDLINKKYQNMTVSQVFINSQWDNEKTNPNYTLNELFADIVYASGVAKGIKRDGMKIESLIDIESNEKNSLYRMLDNGFINIDSFNINETNIFIIPPKSSGLLFDLTKWSYKSRIKPVLEVSLTSVIGLLSGICGKMWQLPTKAGLNNYLILCAKSGIGKEGLHTTKDDVVKAVLKYNNNTSKTIKEFILNEDFVSGQALIKYCANKCEGFSKYISMCNYQKEFGKKLSSMNDKIRDTNSQTIKSAFLSLYTGSAQDDVLNGMSYSNKDNNVLECNAPAYSIVGETTTTGYAEAISPSMAQDGFLSRFTTITYKGKSVPQNYEGINEPIPQKTLEAISDLAEFSADKSGLKGSMYTNFVTVNLDVQAREFSQLIEDFVLKMLDEIGDKEYYRQAWNRSQLKILKLAGICAVGQNYSDPLITIQHMAWATRVVFLDIANNYQLIQDGETNLIENLDNVIIDNIKNVIKEFLTDKDILLKVKICGTSEQVLKRAITAKVVPFSYIFEKLKDNKAILKSKFGYVKTLTEMLKSMDTAGLVQTIEKSSSLGVYGFNSVSYKVIKV